VKSYKFYLTFPKSVGEPPEQLKGFAKTALRPVVEEKTVQIALDADEFKYWDEQTQA
jgi:hypothetical protein